MVCSIADWVPECVPGLIAAAMTKPFGEYAHALEMLCGDGNDAIYGRWTALACS